MKVRDMVRIALFVAIIAVCSRRTVYDADFRRFSGVFYARLVEGSYIGFDIRVAGLGRRARLFGLPRRRECACRTYGRLHTRLYSAVFSLRSDYDLFR